MRALGLWPRPPDTQRHAHLLGRQPWRQKTTTGRPGEAPDASPLGNFWLPVLWWEDCKRQLTQTVAQIPFGGQSRRSGGRPGRLC